MSAMVKIETASASVPDRRAERLLRFPEVQIRTGLSESTMRRREAKGTFPPRITLGPKMVAWYESQIDGWVADPNGYVA